MATPRGRLGQWGEQHAHRFIENKGYTVTTTNYRSRLGEVDIVAQDGSELVFVEVKTRRGTALGTPEESVTATKAKRLIATAQDYLQKNDLEQAPWRINVVSIHLASSGKLLDVNHIQSAVGE